LEGKPESGNRGFSRVEAIVALLILLIGVFGLAMIQLTAVTARNQPASTRVRVATDLAQDTLDRLQEVEWNSLRSSRPDGFMQGTDGVSPSFFRLHEAAGDSVSVQGTNYYRIWQVTPDSEIPALKTIAVWCCWFQGEVGWRQVVLVTQRADAGF
jgi:Tfp pilus assembly protein PilV